MSAAGWLHDARQRTMYDPRVSAELYNDVIAPLIETIEDLLEAAGEKSHHRDPGRIWNRDAKAVRNIIERRLR